MTFKIKNDCRCFKKDTEYRIVPNSKGILYVCGKNGSGKSTLLHVMRHHKDSLRKINMKMFDGMEDMRIASAALEPIELDGFEYDEAFHLDSVTDDPLSYINAGTAVGLINGGGMASQKRSRGENSLIQLDALYQKTMKYLTETYGHIDKWKESGKQGLVVLDEIDEGIDMHLQFGFNAILERLFIDRLGCDVICVSHNAICLKSESDCKVSVFDISLKMKMIVDEYLRIATGKKLEITDLKNE